MLVRNEPHKWKIRESEMIARISGYTRTVAATKDLAPERVWSVSERDGASNAGLQHVADHTDEVVGFERLGHVLVGSEVLRARHVDRTRLRRAHDDLRTRLPAGELGQH